MSRDSLVTFQIPAITLLELTYLLHRSANRISAFRAVRNIWPRKCWQLYSKLTEDQRMMFDKGQRTKEWCLTEDRGPKNDVWQRTEDQRTIVVRGHCGKQAFDLNLHLQTHDTQTSLSILWKGHRSDFWIDKKGQFTAIIKHNQMQSCLLIYQHCTPLEH